MKNKAFHFQVDEKVVLEMSGEQGVVLGRCEYRDAENGYYVRYKSADGRQVEQWWGESALKKKMADA